MRKASWLALAVQLEISDSSPDATLPAETVYVVVQPQLKVKPAGFRPWMHEVSCCAFVAVLASLVQALQAKTV